MNQSYGRKRPPFTGSLQHRLRDYQSSGVKGKTERELGNVKQKSIREKVIEPCRGGGRKGGEVGAVIGSRT